MNKSRLEDLGKYIVEGIPKTLKVSFDVSGDMLVIRTEPKYIVRLMFFLRDNAGCSFKQLVDLCAVDYPEKEKRFEVVYHLLSLKHNRRIMLKVSVDEDTEVPSVTSAFSSAGWCEREVFDMFGIVFSDSPDTRRILTSYDFEGHPLRKDFPLTGHVQVRYDEEKKKVVSEPVNLDMEYRSLDLLSPWEGCDYDDGEKVDKG